MLSRLTLVLSIVMICLVVILLLPLPEIGDRKGKRIGPNHLPTTAFSTIDIDTEIMRRVQRIGSFTGKDFVKSGDIRKD
jgi:hypothetical protein